MIYQLNPPDNEQTARIKREVREAESYNYSTKLALGPRKLKQLENIVKKNYTAWDESYGKVREDLKSLNRLMEGTEEPTDFPFGAESSSQINLRLPAEKFRSLRANFRRAVFGNPQLIVAKLQPGANMDTGIRNKVESAINWTLSETSNLANVLKDSDLPCFRDGTALIYGDFVREVESGIDCKVYTDIKEFQSDYPDFETAGCTEDEYNEILDTLLNPVDEPEVRVEYELDFVSRNGPQYTLFPLINFIHYPFFPDIVRDLTIYGYTFKEGRNKFLEKRKHNYYYSEAVENIFDKFDSTTYEDEWDTERDRVEGIETEYKDAYKFAMIIVKADLDNDRRTEVYKVIYWPEKERILRVERYRIRKNIPCVVPFKFIGRDGRLAGVSLLKDGKDMFGEINAFHRNRSNTRRLTSDVTILAPESMKEALGENYKFTPGGVLWAPNDLFLKGELPHQLQLSNLDAGGSEKEEAITLRYLEGLLGPSLGMSGQENPSDPNAPGNKTAMLLQQANYRVSDYIDEWKRPIPDLMALHTALLYQNSKSKIAFRNLYGEEEMIESFNLVSDYVKYALAPNGLSMSPEQEAAKIGAVAQSAMQFGGIPVKIDPEILVNLWNDYITALRIPGWERYMIRIKPGPVAPPATPSGAPQGSPQPVEPVIPMEGQ